MANQNLEALIEFTKDEDAHARALAIAGLAKIKDERGFAPVLVALFDPVDEVRIAAAMALCMFGDERAVEPLALCSEDENEQVALDCIWALGRIPATSALKALFEIASDVSRSEDVRTTAITAVGERAEIEGSDLATSDELIEDTREVMTNIAREDTLESIRSSAFWVLGHLPKDDATVQLCLDCLKEYGTPKAQEWTIRYAAEALAYLGAREAIEPLEQLAEQASGEVANIARKALDKLRTC